MSTNLIIASIIFSSFIIIFILILLRRRKINIKYSLIWILLFTILFIAALVPNFLIWITHVLGFTTSSNMVFSLKIGVLIVISIALTLIVSTQDRKIRLMIQEVSILKKDTNCLLYTSPSPRDRG